MAVTSNTPSRMVIGAGDLYVNEVDVGATKPEGSFTLEQEIFWPELAGTGGPIAGTGKVIKEIATLTFTLAEITFAKLIVAVPTLASSSDATSEYSTTPNLGMIASADHVTVEWRGELTNAKDFRITLYNAIANGGISMNLADGAETNYEVSFRGYYASSTPKQRCWKMSIEK